MQNSLCKLFEHKCVLEVCEHIHPIMIKIHPVFFFFIPIFSNQAVLRFLSEWRSFCTGHSHDSWLTRPSYLRSALSELSTIVSTSVQGRQECLRLSYWGALLLDVIMNIAVIIYSQHLSRWRRRGLTFLSFLEGNAPIPICLNASKFARIISDPASPPEEVSIKGLLWIFANRLS